MVKKTYIPLFLLQWPCLVLVTAVHTVCSPVIVKSDRRALYPYSSRLELTHESPPRPRPRIRVTLYYRTSSTPCTAKPVNYFHCTYSSRYYFCLRNTLQLGRTVRFRAGIDLLPRHGRRMIPRCISFVKKWFVFSHISQVPLRTRTVFDINSTTRFDMT